MPRRRRKTNRAEVERAYSREELKAHIKRLGLHSEAEYQKWCKNRGLGGGLYRSKHQKRKERHLASVSPGEAVLSRARGQTRNRGNTLRQLYDKSLSKGRLGADYLYRVRAAFSRLESDPPARRAYLELLLAIEPHERLFGLEPALPHLGATPENTWMDGLSRLARLHERWVRPLKDWRPDTHNARRQFAHLARYLLARYNEVPDFLDAAWFFGDDDVARRRQGWFLHLGGGGNLRTAPDLPVQLTKRMAHVFLQGESHRTPEQALRWAQVKGQGGSQSLAEAILQTRIAQTFEHEDFWASVITFFVRNPMLDPVHVGPIVDFLHNQKFVRAERLLPGGEVELDDPPQPNLSMKSRSIDKLLRQVEEWHEELANRPIDETEERPAARRSAWNRRRPLLEWTGGVIADFELKEGSASGQDNLRWSIRELRSNRELAAEGKAMSHCVLSYAKSCRSGGRSIWSLGVRIGNNPRRQVLTIAVDPFARRVTEVRGRYNALPGSGKNLKGGIDKAYARLMSQARMVMDRWIQREQLTLAV